MKNKILIIMGGIAIAGVISTVIAAVCNVSHQNPCSHQHPSGNQSACWNGPNNQGVITCVAQTNQYLCNSIDGTNAIAYEVNQDFPTSCIDCPSLPPSEGGSYLEHHNCDMPLAPCYRSVSCTWDRSLLQCVRLRGSEGPWILLQKRTRSDCD